MNTTPSQLTHPHERALVLGGGGSTGNAWLIGIVAGLFDAGLDVTQADLTIGTSAGSTAAAQFAGASPADLFAAAAAAPPARTAPPGATAPGPASPASDSRPAPLRPTAEHFERMLATIAASADAADYRRRIGAVGREREEASDASVRDGWRSAVAARLPRPGWPERRILITAIDATTGDPVVFDRDSGVDLVDAVAASCAGSVAYRIGERLYLDGGYRSNAENADLAAGHDRVLVLSPLGARSLTPEDWGTHPSTQVEELRAHGSRVEVVIPDPDAEHLFGTNGMNVSLRPAAARAGYDQGRALAPSLAAFWS
ncbi:MULTISPECIES: patatin-like phospholipase family protein [unclassified Leifsonia]|uniref:patatin-like phospholipase family protein n=1 Tax=unclassified Leifsonia TaxID=2663824 RepID=UPI0008A74CBB|nr:MULTISPECIES: patatin-like phospholipase family protein [unclassified Leifsonia]SEH91976.1 NTE family protein [Leifsonia sp. CL154]SFL51686.1 NTE family protein [Leifsonia sp. CL147]